jgi:quinoprotein glucose dehydrogenase
VQFFAAIALGKLGRAEAAAPLLDLLRRNDDRDPCLRHAAVMGLTGLKDLDSLKRAARDPSPAVRTGVLLTLRRLEDPAVAEYLNDAEPRLVLEAARAINDVPIAAAMPRLAALEPTATTPLPLLRRVANANFRIGGAENARALAEIAARGDLPEAIRARAIEMLGEWPKPSGRDKVMGLWRPLAPRPASLAVEALRPKLKSLLASAPGALRQAAIHAASSLAMKEAGPLLAALVVDKNSTDDGRAEALKALDRIEDPGRIDLARRVLDAGGGVARVEALRILVKADPTAARTAIDSLLEKGTPRERQGAFAVLAENPDPATDQVLLAWLDRLISGKVPPEIQLDLIEAAGRKASPELRTKLERYEAARPKTDPLAAYRETLAGGDARRGRQVFLSKAEVSCLRCHKITTRGGQSFGGEVGPELTGVGSRQDREYLLESIVSPDRKIAQGFESVVLATSDGKVVTGVLRGEDDKQLRLMTAEGQPLTVPKDDIEDRKRGPSAMPADLAGKLTKSELRDLIEFLANLKAK